MGLVADPHRPHAPVARQGGGDALLEIGAAGDAIAGPQAAVLALPHDIGDIAQVLLHGAGGPQAVEGGDDEIGVPQPAEAVIPVTLGPRGLGDGGGEGGDDRPGLLETAQLEGDGGADDLVLPLEGDGQGAYPAMPVVQGPLQKGAGGLGDAGGQALIGAEDEVQRPVARRPGGRRWSGAPRRSDWRNGRDWSPGSAGAPPAHRRTGDVPAAAAAAGP